MSPVNTDELELALMLARQRVLKIQTKLHRWARDDPRRRFDDLFNLVADPGFLLVAWDRVSGNKGAVTAGVDRRTASSIAAADGVEVFLDALRSAIKDRSFCPLPVRERMIPKAGGKLRRLGIPTVTDRVVQASLKLVLEPSFEAGFLPCSYGFRPRRRAHDAVAAVRYLATRPRCYEWVVEGDIKACFDEIDHTALMGRVRRRVGDSRVLALVKAFLKAGILTEDAGLEDSTAGTPQGGILTPPTQLAIRPYFALRVGLRAVVGPAAGVVPHRDGVADGDLVRADEHVFDEQAQDALAFGDGRCGGLAAQPGEEVFEVVGELEVDLPVGELAVQRVDLVVQAGLAGAQLGHAGAELVEGDQLLLVGADEPGDRRGGL